MSIAQDAARATTGTYRCGRRSYAGLPSRAAGARLPRSASSSAYGFWIFLLSDIVMFSAFFAAYAVLSGRPPAARAGSELFNHAASRSRPRVCCCRATPAASPASARRAAQRSHVSTAAWRHLRCSAPRSSLLEIREFAGMIAQGAGPTRSAFLSAFFTLVGCHGLHVTRACSGS